ncbi:MAG: ABC transporter ATP-binding protein [Planctomycetota bacterium]
MTATTPAVEIRGLTRRYGDQVALAGLDLTLERGEFLGLLGPNGAGKTTTLRMISCMDRPDAGTCRVLGMDVGGQADPILARLGVVPQELALYDAMTARENLEFLARLQGLSVAKAQERIAQALEAAGLKDRADTRVQGFSGGMKRRLNLVASLLHGPELVLLDEPTVGVDPQSRNHLLEMIEGLRGQVSLIYTTHQMGEIERLCDRIAIMDRGRLVAIGTMDELRAQAAGGGATALQLERAEDRERALQVLAEAGIGLRAVHSGGDLEEIFLATTGRSLRDEVEQ